MINFDFELFQSSLGETNKLSEFIFDIFDLLSKQVADDIIQMLNFVVNFIFYLFIAIK